MSEKKRERITEKSRFDIASVTKAVVTSVLFMRALERGALRLDDRLSRWLAPLHPSLKEIRLQQLLQHRSGLAPWHPFFEALPPAFLKKREGRDEIRRLILEEGRAYSPGEERYSDLGYILLAWILERALDRPFDEAFAEEIAAPLHLERATFVDLTKGDQPLLDTPATEVVPWRGGLIQGEVHDGNTAAMGGVSGHAGLFCSAAELGALARGLLQVDSGTATHWLKQETLRTFWEAPRGPGSYRLGWDTPSGPRSNAGSHRSPESVVGHLGFTGSSLWIDRQSATYVVLLTNRVHPSREEPRIRLLRPEIHDLAWAHMERRTR